MAHARSHTKMAVVSVPTPGTRVQFVSQPTPIRSLQIFAPIGNAGNVYVGGSDVSSTVFGVEMPIEGGGHVTIDFPDRSGELNEFYVDAATANDKISYIAILV